jgi:hypothetical protein
MLNVTYHTKRYPHRVTVCLNDKQYNKVKKNKSEIIRNLIDNHA